MVQRYHWIAQHSPPKLNTYLLKLYQDRESPLHHGFSTKHKSVMYSKFSLGALKSLIMPYVDADIIIKPSDADYGPLITELFRDECVLEDCHCAPKKGDFPPTNAVLNEPPLLSQLALSKGIDLQAGTKKGKEKSPIAEITALMKAQVQQKMEFDKMDRMQLQSCASQDAERITIADHVQSSVTINFDRRSLSCDLL